MQDLVTILIADDETAIRYGLEEIVESGSEGLKVIATADNGVEALLFLEQFKPDIAIIDINMPKYDGLEVIKLAIQSGCRTRFFILSGYNDFSYAQTAIRYGVKNYFLKPINIPEFLKELNKQGQEVRAQRRQEESLSPKRLNALVQSSRIYFLNQLIQSRENVAKDITNKLTELQLTLDDNRPCLVVIFSFFGMDQQALPPISEIVNDEIRKFINCAPMEYWVYNDTQVLCVFHQNDPKDPLWRGQLSAYIKYLKEKYTLTVLAGIGRVISALEQIAASYSSALEALSYHIYDTGADIYDTDIISSEKPTFSKENIDYKPIIYAVTHGNEQGIREYCHAFFQSLLFIKMPPPNFFIGMCMYLIMNVQKQITLLYPDKKMEFEFHYEELDALGSTSAIQNWMIGFFIRYGEMMNDTPEQDNSIIKASKEYILNNLHKNIKAKDVSAHVNLSETYFSIYFKDKTGINFRDYLLSMRMNQAKKLLREKDVTISEVAWLTGYQDYRSFSRAFKNETGMSPSEYAK